MTEYVVASFFSICKIIIEKILLGYEILADYHEYSSTIVSVIW